MADVAKTKERWSPAWCSHVVGEYDMPRTFNDDGLPEVQIVTIWCEHQECSDRPKPHYRVPCSSGNVRQHISRFALAHYHADPLGRPKT